MTLFNNKILQKWRHLLFPLIDQGLITCYNTYVNRQFPDVPFVVRYYHSDLDVDANGKEQAHRRELFNLLKRNTDIDIFQHMVTTVANRMAVYKRGPWKTDPNDVTLYTSNGRLLNPKEIQQYCGIIIVEGNQYELSIGIGEKRGVNHILNLLNKYTYDLQLDEKGKITKNKNLLAIAGAWEIPLIVV